MPARDSHDGEARAGFWRRAQRPNTNRKAGCLGRLAFNFENLTKNSTRRAKNGSDGLEEFPPDD